MTLLSRHTLPLGLKGHSHKLPWDGAERATFTLLRAGQRDVLLTCFHVVKRLQEMQAADPSAQIVAYLTSAPRLIEVTGFILVDHDERSDVAVFGALENTLELPGAKFIDYGSSYLTDPAPGEPVIIVGYPGATVAVVPNMADFGFVSIIFAASSVSDRAITLANESGTRKFVDYADPNRSGMQLGGLSGSPAFVVRNNWHRFVGIVTECSERDQTIIISRLGFIKPDGTFDCHAIPW